MANPATLTITDTTANSAVNQPAVQTIDTTGTVPIAIAGKGSERLLIEVINAAAAALTVKVNAAANPPGLQSQDLSISMAASGTATDKRIIGPLESSRYIQSDGSLSVTFTPASGSPNATVRVYRLPKYSN